MGNVLRLPDALYSRKEAVHARQAGGIRSVGSVVALRRQPRRFPAICNRSGFPCVRFMSGRMCGEDAVRDGSLADEGTSTCRRRLQTTERHPRRSVRAIS